MPAASWFAFFFHHLFLFQLAQQRQQQQQGGGGLGAGAGPGGGVGGPDLSALRDNNQIAQLRELVSQNPTLIQPLIQQLAAGNPQLAQILSANPEALLNMFEESGEGSEDAGEGLPGVQVVNVTPEEQAAIERVSWETWKKKGRMLMRRCSFKRSDSLGRRRFRHILHATRTRS